MENALFTQFLLKCGIQAFYHKQFNSLSTFCNSLVDVDSFDQLAITEFLLKLSCSLYAEAHK